MSARAATGRKLPPYAKDLAKKRLTGASINLYVCAGRTAWDVARARANNHADVLVLPPGEDPYKYTWPVRGLDVLLSWPDGDYASLCRFADLLIQSGARKVIAPWAEDKDGVLSFYPLTQARRTA